MNTQIKKKDIISLIALFLILIVVLVVVMGIMPARTKIKQAQEETKTFLADYAQKNMKNSEEIKKLKIVESERDALKEEVKNLEQNYQQISANTKYVYISEEELNNKIYNILLKLGFSLDSNVKVSKSNNTNEEYTIYELNYSFSQSNDELGLEIVKPDTSEENYDKKLAFYDQIVSNVPSGYDTYFADSTVDVFYKKAQDGENYESYNIIYSSEQLRGRFGRPDQRIKKLFDELTNIKNSDEQKVAVSIKENKIENTTLGGLSKVEYAKIAKSNTIPDETELKINRYLGKITFKMEIFIKTNK